MAKHKNILVILLGKKKVTVSQVEQTGNNCRLVKCADYILTKGVSMEEYPGNFSWFSQFVQEHGFKGNKAVVGLSTKYVVTTEVDLPPIKDISSLPGILRLNLEKKSMLNSSETLIDYSGEPGGAPSHLLVVSVLTKQVNEVKKMLSAVSIQPVSITLSLLAAAYTESGGVICSIVVGSDYAEILVQKNGSLKNLRYIPLRSDPNSGQMVSRKIAIALQRLIADEISSDAPIKIRLISANRDRSIEEAVARIHDKIEFIQHQEKISSDILTESCQLAAELGRKYISDDKLPIDFLHTRINGKKESRIQKMLPRILTASALLILFLGYLAVDWHMDVKAIALYQEKLSSISDNVESAKEVIHRISFARNWYEKNPRFLDSLRELTLLFPEKGDIWLSSLAVDESFNQVITGKAIEERAVLDVLDNLEKSEHFRNVKMLYIRQAAKNSSIVSFAFNFQYVEAQ
jgi:hypothetical protein